jgi:glycosyltransferase involved in cell wall biosynthesis
MLGAMIEIVVPVHNEQTALERSIRSLHAFLTAEMPFVWRVVIADNASTDATLAIARSLARELDAVAVLRLEAKGRGRALRAAWSASDADVVAYMDVDLSTDLRALLPLVSGLISGHSDVAIGTRLAAGARVERGFRRELISRAYNRLLRVVLRARFSDAQCGFKALRADVAHRLLPLIRDDGWFFDTELLVVAQRLRLRIHEVPVDWVDDPDSRVDIVRTAAGDLRGIGRMLISTRLVRPTSAGTRECLDGREHGGSDLRHADGRSAAGRRADRSGDVREDDRGGGDRDDSVLARARLRHDGLASAP